MDRSRNFEKSWEKYAEKFQNIMFKIVGITLTKWMFIVHVHVRVNIKDIGIMIPFCFKLANGKTGLHELIYTFYLNCWLVKCIRNWAEAQQVKICSSVANENTCNWCHFCAFIIYVEHCQFIKSDFIFSNLWLYSDGTEGITLNHCYIIIYQTSNFLMQGR